MKPTTFDFFFDIASGYSYLAHSQVEPLAQRSGVRARWRPFLLGAVFKATGNETPARLPAKAAWLVRDMALWAQQYGMPLQFPSRFPFNSVSALRLLVAAGRLHGDEAIPRLAKTKGLKTMVGAWISHDRERNEREIQALIKLAGEGMVNLAVVGNEVLLRGELPEEELLACIARVKAALPEGVPVGCVDAYYQFLERPALTAACDVLLPNCYPFWEGADIAVAAQYLRRMHGLVKAAGGDKPVVVAETGWPGQGLPLGSAVP